MATRTAGGPGATAIGRGGWGRPCTDARDGRDSLRERMARGMLAVYSTASAGSAFTGRRLIRRHIA